MSEALRNILRTCGGHGSKTDPATLAATPGLTRLLIKNVLLLRFCDQRDVLLPEDLAAAARKERERISEALVLIDKVHQACLKRGLPHVFTKSFQHWPDMGHDIDLLVGEGNFSIDKSLITSEGASITPPSLVNRVARKSNLRLANAATEVEIHHGRIGHVGEHETFARLVLKRSVPFRINDKEYPVPCREDQFVLQVQQRLYGHFYFRLADILNGFQLANDPSLNWDLVRQTAAQIGILPGLRAYMGILNGLHREILGSPHPVLELTAPLKYPGVSFRNEVLRMNLPWGPLRLIGHKMLDDLSSLRLKSLGRLLLIFPLSLTPIARKLGLIR